MKNSFTMKNKSIPLIPLQKNLSSLHSMNPLYGFDSYNKGNSSTHQLGLNKKIQNLEKLKKIYEKCYFLSRSLVPEEDKKNNYQDFLSFSSLENQNQTLQKKTKSIRQITQRENPKQVVFSTVSKIDSKKKINLLFSIQEFVSITNEVLGGRSARVSGTRTKEYSEILLCMRKLRSFYGFIPLKQFNQILVQAKKSPGYFSKNFFSLIERRLDIVLFRSGFTKTIVEARQACLHSKVFVNSKLCSMPSTKLNPGDIITFKENCHLNSTSSFLSLKKENVDINDNENKADFSTEKNQSLSLSEKKLIFKDQLTSEFRDKLFRISIRDLRLLALFCAKSISLKILQREEFEKRARNDFTQLGSWVRVEFKDSIKKLVCVSFPDEHLSLSNLSVGSNFMNSSKDSTTLSLELDLKKEQKKKSLFFLDFNLVLQKLGKYSPILALNIQKNIFLALKSLSKNIDDTSVQKSFNEVKDHSKLTLKNQMILLNKIERSFDKNVKKGLKPTHLEISSITNTLIFLYSPQKVSLPFHFDVDILLKTITMK